MASPLRPYSDNRWNLDVRRISQSGAAPPKRRQSAGDFFSSAATLGHILLMRFVSTLAAPVAKVLQK
jgi:hypothetical protein